MTTDVFAVERYDESGGTRPLEPPPALAGGARVTCAVHLAADDVLLALVEGADEQVVRSALSAAGWRYDRVTAGAWLTPPTGSAGPSDAAGLVP